MGFWFIFKCDVYLLLKGFGLKTGSRGRQMTFKRHLTSHRIINTWFVVPNTFFVIILMAVKSGEVTLGSSAGKATHVLERGLRTEVRRAALPLEVVFLLKSPQFFHREEKEESLLHFQRLPEKTACLPHWCWASYICLYNHDPQNHLPIAHNLPPIFTVKSSATIQLRAARSL